DRIGDVPVWVHDLERRWQEEEARARVFVSPKDAVLTVSVPTNVPPQVAWQWQQRTAWQAGDGATARVASAILGALALAAACAWLRGYWPFARRAGIWERVAFGACVLVAAGGLTVLIALRGGAPVGAAVSLLLGWAALWACMLAPGRLALATAAGLLLVAIGMLVQLELGLAAMDSAMLRHFQKTSALLAVGLGAGTAVRLWLRGRPALLPQAALEPLLAMLAATALAALLLQVAFGDETGVFDLQPVEFAKLALTALTAHCLAVGLGWHAALPDHEPRPLRWLRLGAPALLFMALMGLALVQVDDFSPLILLCLWSAAMVLAWALAARRHGIGAGVLGLGLATAATIVLLRGAGPEQLSEWGFYADRFMVWLEPARHPHTGQQLLAGASAIADGAWWGQDQLLGIASLGLPGSGALAIPAVQDDFAPSFFLNRHGLASGLALWMLQALFLVGLLQTAARAHAAGSAARDFRHAWSGRFRCFALCGGAAFVFGHFLLSWGTNLAIFPVMGQPMSFLSAGGSHLLFFICPLLILGAVSAQSLEENHDAGLCPT
ncbi:MAG: FtsW/RodA/SpoVE family cell cycle protein, partial [Telluria sp.]